MQIHLTLGQLLTPSASAAAQFMPPPAACLQPATRPARPVHALARSMDIGQAAVPGYASLSSDDSFHSDDSYDAGDEAPILESGDERARARTMA